MALDAPIWVNTDFAERILRLSEEDPTVRVIDIFSKPATSKGDNYTSDLIRVTVDFTRKQDQKELKGKKSLLFKFEPMAEGLRKDLIEKINIFDTEIAMMTDTLKKMNEMLGSRLGAQVYHVRMERPLCLIMEDLAPQGFRMADRQAGLDWDHCLLAIRGLAKFHASSVALCERERKHKTMYTKGMFNEDYPEEMANFFVGACRGLADAAESWTELDKSYVTKIRNLVPRLYAKGMAAVKRKDDEFNVINHGDFWVNNMLFRYDETNKPIEHIFVDFQLCIYTSPAVDLLYFLSTSPSIEISENHTSAVLEEYLQALTTTMKRLGCGTQPPTMAELKKMLKERAAYGMISSMTVLPIIVTDKSEVKDIDELMPQNGLEGTVDAPGFKSPLYKRIMSKRIPKYDELGLFD